MRGNNVSIREKQLFFRSGSVCRRYRRRINNGKQRIGRTDSKTKFEQPESHMFDYDNPILQILFTLCQAIYTLLLKPNR